MLGTRPARLGTVMHKFFASIFAMFLSPVGLVALAALDSSMFFFLPMAVEAAVVILTARHRELVWLFPILAAMGSVVGAALTFGIGSKVGDEGLKHWVPERRLKAVQQKIKKKGAVALGSAGLLPPPFPLAPLILACGALEVRKGPFLLAFIVARLLRFSIVAVLAMLYGRWILRFMESTAFKAVVVALVVVALLGTAFSIYRINQSVRRHRAG
jgi:membrane protein YqaA with SNARE-associated domain